MPVGRSRFDRLTLGVLVGAPLALVLAFIWLPLTASVVLSFTSWDGVGAIRPAGLRNYEELLTVSPAFARAMRNNLIFLIGLIGLALPLGVTFAVALDRRLRGSAFYQSALYLPVVLSMALVGFIWQLQYAPEQGFLNSLLGTNRPDNLVDWLGDRDLNIWAALVAAGWRHVGYITLLYLAGLRTVDPTLREAAAIDGAGEWATFRRVVFPVLRPVNVVVLVITAIEAIRAFDIVYVLNRGQNGLELLSVLVVNGVLAEGARIGFASAAAVVLLMLSVLPIAFYLRRAFASEPA